MIDTTLQRELLPDCSVAAVLERVGQGMQWHSFLERALNTELINWAFDLSANSAVVGHTTSFASLESHISATARNSYTLTGVAPVRCQSLAASGQAIGKIKRQTSSADQYAFIAIRAEPDTKSNVIQLAIPRSNEIPDALHSPGLPEAILDGICLASFGQDPSRPIVGFRVTVIEAKWNDVDSHAGVFKRATSMAMSEILLDRPVVE